MRQFPAAELERKITSYAISSDDPFLLAYYADDGSGLLRAPLHVIRYGRAKRELRRGEISPDDCVGSALSIREAHGFIYIDTHENPSAGAFSCFPRR